MKIPESLHSLQDWDQVFSILPLTSKYTLKLNFFRMFVLGGSVASCGGGLCIDVVVCLAKL